MNWVPGRSDEFKEYCESNTVVLDVSPAAPSVSVSDISVSSSCPNKPDGKVEVKNITSLGDVRYLLLEGHGTVPGADCLSGIETNGELGNCLSGIVASGKASKGAAVTITGIDSGAYTLVLINPGGDLGVCYSLHNITIESKPELRNESVETRPTSCHGLNDGVLRAVFSDGVLPIVPKNLPSGASYSTSEDGKSFTINGLAAVENGSLTFEDACGQDATIRYTLASPPPPPTVSVSSATNADCLNYAGGGRPNGSIVLTLSGSAKYLLKAFVSGSSTPFLEEETAASSRTLGGLGAGEYRFEVRHLAYPACPGGVATASLTQPSTLGADQPTTVPVSCTGGSDGSIEIRGSGDASFIYSVSGRASRTSSSAEIFSGLSAGEYSVTVKRTVAGCSDSVFRTVSISQPASLPTLTVEAQPALCNEENLASDDKYRGTVKLKTASGGTPGYSYKLVADGAAWTPQDLDFGTVSSFRVEPGSYSMIVKDAKGCATESAAALVSAPPKLTLAKPSASRIVCNGERSYLHLTASGGTPPYVFKYDGTAFGTEKALYAGEYFIAATDKNGCSEQYPDVLEIEQPEKLLVEAVETLQPSCHGLSDGRVELSAEGGVGGFTYRREGGAYLSSPTFSGLGDGVHRFFVKDAGGCERGLSLALEQPEKLEIKLDEIKHVSCEEDATGRIAASARGGNQDFEWRLDDRRADTGTELELEALSAGKYTLEVVDGKGCAATLEAVIENRNDFSTTVAVVRPECVEKKDGAIALSASGGTAPYYFDLRSDDYENEASSSASFSALGLSDGAYRYGIVDEAGCSSSGEIVLTYSSTLTLSIDSIEGTPCVGAAVGAVELSAAGGSGGYRYRVDEGEWQDSPLFRGLEYGLRRFEVRDGGDCTAQTTAEIPVENVPRLEIISASGPACESASGTMTLAASGGFGDYLYSVDEGELQSSPRFDGLFIGQHFFLMRDASGCEVSVVGNMELENVLKASSTVIKGAPCESAALGEIEISASGGSGIYSYGVDGGEAQNSPRFTGLALGEHVFEVSDGTCSLNSSQIVPVENPPLLSATVARNVSCESSTAGEIELFASGGSGIYSYRADGGEFQSSPRFSGLSFGEHRFELFDGFCSLELSRSISVDNPTGLSARITRHVPCETATVGKAEVAAFGGDGVYSYSVDGGEPQSSPRFSGLGFGEHIFEVVDGEGCRIEARAETRVDNPVEAFTADLRQVPCETATTGFVRLEASGGLGEYLYGMVGEEPGESPLFENLGYGRHRFFVQDSSGCRVERAQEIGVSDPVRLSVNELSGVPCTEAETGFVRLKASGGLGEYLYSRDGEADGDSPLFEGLTRSSYFFSVTDVSGCRASTSAEIPIENPLAIVVADRGTVPCETARTAFVEVGASGGVGIYRFGIDGGEPGESFRFEGLGYGEHRAAVYDASGCLASTECFVDIDSPLQVSVLASGSTACPNGLTGFLEAEARGGVGNYEYSFDGGDFGPSPRIEGLGYGSHGIAARDRAGCEARVEGFVPIVNPIELKIIDKGDVPCENMETGFFELRAEGGSSGKYLYRMDDGEYGASNIMSNASVGKHELYVSDGAGCESRVEGEISAERELSYQIVSREDVFCDNSGQGSLTLRVFGGVGEYLYRCDGGEPQIEPVFEGLDGGPHLITATDAEGCSTTIRETVYNVGDMKVEVEETSAVPCEAAKTGTARVSAVGGDGNYLFRIDGGEWSSSPFFEGLAAGSRKIEAMDEGGCIASTVAEIMDADELKLEIVSATPVRCVESRAGTLAANAYGGKPPYRYAIGNGSPRESGRFEGLPRGGYEVRVEDAQGCSATKEVAIEIVGRPTVSLASSTDAACAGSKSGEIELSRPNDGAGPYLFGLDDGEWTVDARFAGLSPGRHTVRAKDVEGCVASMDVTLGTRNDLTATVLSIVDAPCRTAKSGRMTVEASGGVGPPYLYRLNAGGWSSSPEFAGLSAGEHLVAAKDRDGCSTTVAARVGADEGPKLEIVQIAGTPCHEAKSGYVRLQASGGAGEPYRYRIDDDEWRNEGLFENLKAGIYSTRVVDAMNCSAEISVSLKADMQPPQAEITTERVSCRGGSDGGINVEASGGIPPYEYLWNDARASGPNPKGLTAGIYRLTLTDGAGCKTSTDAKVEQPDDQLSAETKVVPLCFGRTTGTIYVVAKGGTPPYRYETGGAIFLEPELNLEAGRHRIALTDNAGCKFEFVSEIEINEENPKVNFVVASREQATDTLTIKEICLPKADSLQWEFDPEIKVLRYGDSPLIRCDKPGVYKAKLTARYGGCDFSTEKWLNIAPFDPSYAKNLSDPKTGIQALEAFPNPASGGFTAKVKLGAKQKMRIQLFSVTGTLALDKTLDRVDFFEEYITPKFGTGIYILKITTPNDGKECKIVME